MSKIAIVYWSGTGNTKAMANAVAEGAKNARSDGERDAIEKLKARQALPTPMRTIIPVSAEPDFSTMSSEEFARFKRRRFGQ